MKKMLIATTLVALIGAAGSAAAQTINYPDFSSTAGLQLNGNAARNGSLLMLTPAAGGQSGSAFSLNTIALNASASFSTVFNFVIKDRGGLANGADGLTFTVQTNANNVGGGGGGIGYDGIGNSVAVEFDTFDNGEYGGSNHVGIDKNGSVNSVVSTPSLPIDFDNGSPWWAWVDYNGLTQELAVRWAQSATRPDDPMLATTMDLPSILGSTDVFVGFTSGTGAGWGEHDIISWNFVNRYEEGGAPDPTLTPEPGTLVLTLSGLGAMAGLVRRRRHG